MTRERELSRVFPHQVLESLQRHNLPERDVHRLRPGFHAENFSGFVRQMGIQPYRCQYHSHVPVLNLCIYNAAESHVQVKFIPIGQQKAADHQERFALRLFLAPGRKNSPQIAQRPQRKVRLLARVGITVPQFVEPELLSPPALRDLRALCGEILLALWPAAAENAFTMRV